MFDPVRRDGGSIWESATLRSASFGKKMLPERNLRPANCSVTFAAQKNFIWRLCDWVVFSVLQSCPQCPVETVASRQWSESQAAADPEVHLSPQNRGNDLHVSVLVALDAAERKISE